jgi:hypothetical protein
MVNLSILVPEGTTNYIKNPSLRQDMTGWVAYGSTISRVLTYARFGIASLKVVTNGTVFNEGVYYRVNDLVNSDEPATISVYIRGEGQVRLRLVDNHAGNEWSSDSYFLTLDKWTRLNVSGRCSKSNDMRLYVETSDDTARAITFYVDAAQMETKPYPTTFCDGTRPGCRWSGLYDASASSRSAYTREGGRWVVVTGPKSDREDIYMTVATGLGVAPILNNRQSYALSPGGFLDNFKIDERPISFKFNTKNKSIPRTCKQSLTLSKLHELRQVLIDLIKPDKTGGNEPFWIEYQDGDTPLYLKVYYDGGLEGDWDIRNQWVMEFTLNLLTLSPMFVEDSQDNVAIDFQESSIFNGIAGRINGEWNNLNSGGNAGIGDIEIGRDGEVYISGGGMSSINYNVAAVDPFAPVSNVAYYNGVKWTALATVMSASAVVNDVCIAPNGDVYITGKFTTVDGVAATNVAKYNYSTGTWSALGTGVDNDGLHVQAAPNGDVYVGGYFHTAGGVPAYHIARWDGSSWHSVGAQAGLNDDVYTIAISKDGTKLYVGGKFTDDFGESADGLLRIAEYTVSTNAFTAMGDGLNGAVREVIISPSNYIYICGDFTLSGIATMNYVSRWNGSAWEQLGTGLSGGIAYSMDISEKGEVLVVGAFTSAGGISARSVAMWNGSTWVNLDVFINIATTPTPFAVNFNGDDIIVGGGSFSGFVNTSIFSGITYVTNEGTAEVRPTCYIKGSGKLRYMENQSTGKRIWFNLDINKDEEIYIDFGAGKFYSTVRGDLFYSLLPGSDFHAFTLIPGVNKIATFIHDDVDAVMTMFYTPTHWSVDSTQHGEEF